MAETAAIDPNELRALDRAIGDLALLSGRSINSVMKQMIPRVARSAAKATAPNRGQSAEKIARTPKNRKRDKITLGRYSKKRGERGIPIWADYRLDVWEQGRGGSSKKVDQYVTAMQFGFWEKIPNRGVAKMAWLGAIPRELAGLTSGIAGGVKGARRYSRGRLLRERGQIIGAKLENRIRYIGKAGAGSEMEGIKAQRNWLGKALKREEDKIARKFASATRRAIGGLI
jgi:hypothetical protein